MSIETILNKIHKNIPLTEEEYDDVVNYALTIGVNMAFIQEGDTASESFIPNFDNIFTYY